MQHGCAVKNIVIGACAVICVALCGHTLHAATTAKGTEQISLLHSQITQFAKPPFASPHQITIDELQSLMILAQKYFDARAQYERPIYEQIMRDYDTRRYREYPRYKEPRPTVKDVLLKTLQKYVDGSFRQNSDDVIKLRDILRQVQTMDPGHLSGSVWFYDNLLATFASDYLPQIDEQIIQTSLSDAAALRKKHQYTVALEKYKTLLADYANSLHAAPIKVLLDAAIVEDYNYQAKVLLGKHNYQKARAAYRKIIELYPDTDYASSAEANMNKAVSAAVVYFRSQADESFHPQGNIGVPQSKAKLYYSLMYEIAPEGPQADYAYYRWCEALGTEAKELEAINKLKQFPAKFPHSKLMPKALFLIGFLLGAAPLSHYDEATTWLQMVVQKYSRASESSEALWYLAFFSDANGDTAAVKKWLEQLSHNYPESPRATPARQWLGNLKNMETR